MHSFSLGEIDLTLLRGFTTRLVRIVCETIGFKGFEKKDFKKRIRTFSCRKADRTDGIIWKQAKYLP